jgi:aminoglycoside/choline kinase family phosphotransferase
MQDHKTDFLNKHLKEPYELQALPFDMSFRRYYRVHLKDKTLILMDASQELTSIEPFIKVGEFLYNSKYSAPQILAKHPDLGLILLEDLGENSYAKALSNYPNQMHDLYKRATDVLISLHQKPVELDVEVHTKERLVEEVLLFVDMYVKTMNGVELSEGLRKEFIKIWDNILHNLHYKDSTLVLRDFHIDNLMWLPDRTGVQKIGLLDFQDAVRGSFAYDLVSLLEDVRRDIPEPIVEAMIGHYLENMSSMDRKKFMTDYIILGMQRNSRIAGVIARKSSRDKDNRYLKLLPRTLGYIRKSINNPIFEQLKNWCEKIDLPGIVE